MYKGVNPIALAERLAGFPEIVFAYLHGSSLESHSPGDIDLAVYIDHATLEGLPRGQTPSLDLLAPMELCCRNGADREIDLILLNHAPLSFRFRAISTGRVLVDRDPIRRAEFEYLTRAEYFDFEPRRKEYLRGAAA